MTSPLIIIGSGLAAYSLARDWRRQDSETPLTIITAEDGDFYSKPLLSTALAKQKTLDELVIAKGAKQAQQFNAELLTQQSVKALDTINQKIMLDDQTLQYSQCVLALGGQSITVPLSGDASDAVLSVNSLMDYRLLQPQIKQSRRVLVMGAGLVGMELANDMSAIGIEVTLVDPAKLPLTALLPKQLGEVMVQVFSDANIDWRLGSAVKEICRVNDAYQVQLSTQETIEVDAIISAVGIKPNISLAQAAGLTVNRGIVVDQYCQASTPGIFALGDCAEVMGQWRPHIMPIMHCSKALSQTLVGEKTPVHYPVMPVIVKTPLCPIIAMIPAGTISDDWSVDGEGQHLRARLFDELGQLKGFVLMGDRIDEKAQCIKDCVV